MQGVTVGTVKSVADPNGEGRVLIDFPWMEGKNQSYWASPATLMSGGGRGSWFMPEIGDEVLIAFDQNDDNHPFIVGFLWNGQDKPPETDPHKRVIQSVNGHRIELYDPDISEGDTGHIRISDANGNVIELKNGQITIQSVGALEIIAPVVNINGRPVMVSPSPI